MRIFHSPDHELHAPKQELHRGEMIIPHEGPHRMELMIAGLKRAGLLDFQEPDEFDLSAIAAVHSIPYLDFLQNAWQRWQDAGYAGDVLPMSYPHGARRSKPPEDIDGAAGYFAASSDAVITKTTWLAVKAGADCALAASDQITDGGVACALTRPPGHHAGADYMAGYCFLNNTAIAAQHLISKGAAKVAILDVDFHHGNGTQDIFYARDDVLFASIHGDPDHHFPYFWGHVDETGYGEGEGYNINYPLAPGSGYPVWKQALQAAFEKINAFEAEALIVSLGVDTFEHDPISSFRLRTADYSDYGRNIGKLGLPTCFIAEGGYGVPEVGDNIAAVLTGFMDG